MRLKQTEYPIRCSTFRQLFDVIHDVTDDVNERFQPGPTAHAKKMAVIQNTACSFAKLQFYSVIPQESDYL